MALSPSVRSCIACLAAAVAACLLTPMSAVAQKEAPGPALVVAAPSLPELLSPATAWTEVERQALELLFDRLYRLAPPSAFGKRYLPQLATALPDGSLTPSIPLRRDVVFTDGNALTVADIRATAQLMNHAEAAGRSALWRDYLEVPRVEEDRWRLNLSYQQGLFDPLAPLTFWILPRFYKGKELEPPDDAEFARAPVGSGPFQYMGRKEDMDKPYALFQANPHDARRGSIAEIRMVAWKDARKDLAKPLPHLILDAPTDQLAALKELGYVEAGAGKTDRVYFLAANQRKASLASANGRRAIAHAIDRQTLLDQHFRGAKLKYHTTSNGLFPRESWANAPAPQIPEQLFDLDRARSLARKVKTETPEFAWTLKYPIGEPRVHAACTEMAAALAALFQEAGIKANVQAQGLTPPLLRKALDERDFDLLYLSADGLDDPVRLSLLFDRQESATRPGGANYLGCDGDGKLQDLLRAARQYRQFSTVEENMQAIHLHLNETMPAIPLWQLDVHVLLHPSLQTPPIDPRAVFARIREWKVK